MNDIAETDGSPDRSWTAETSVAHARSPYGRELACHAVGFVSTRAAGLLDVSKLSGAGRGGASLEPAVAQPAASQI